MITVTTVTKMWLKMSSHLNLNRAQATPQWTVKQNKVEFQKFPWHHGSELAVWQEWRKPKVEGKKDVSACVGLCWGVFRSIPACLDWPKPLLRASTLTARAGTDRQLLLNPDCFRFTGCERAWLRGCDPSEGGPSPPPHLPLTGRWKEGEDWEEGWGGGDCRHHVTHVSCWADQNGIWTKTHHLLLPASGWQPLVPMQKCHPQRHCWHDYRFLPS